MPETRDCGGEVAAYALGSLEPAETEAFREHLETCVVCRDELPAFQEVVSVLSMGVTENSAPSGIRRRMLRTVRDEPTGVLERSSGRPPRRSAWRARLPGPGLVLGALLGAVTVGIGGVVLSSHPPGQRLIQARVVGASGRAQLRMTGGHAILIVNHLPPSPAGLVYEVWLQRGRGAPSPTSALFSVDTTGAGHVDVPGTIDGVSQVTVTQEPAGGSRVPNHAPVIVAHLP
jgi:Anti-sigma-K factor rskA/Putative zinc-finger